jgi:nicotinamidase-related amidase
MLPPLSSESPSGLRAWPLLRPENTILLVVDLQTKLVPVIHERERLLKNSSLLLRLAEILAIPVVLTAQYRKGLGPVVPEIQELAPTAALLDKTSFGCFGDEAFGRTLAAIERGQLLVCGIETHICVLQTVIGALANDYEVHVAADATGARSHENHERGLARMERLGAVLSSAEMAIYELLGRSDSSAFKQMLPHLK